MTGGLMQLVAYGTQDIYLTGNPQITYFKVVYRRHTNFALETIEQPFNGTINFGRSVSSFITRSADLVSRVFVQVTINSVDPNGAKFAWVRRLGHAIISQVEVQLGGTIIDRQYGIWLDIWYELARKGDQEIGYAKMIGDVNILTNYNDLEKPEYTMYIPLQFWFNKFVGLSIPLIALQYQDLYINVEFENVNKLVIRDCNFNMNLLSIKDASLLVDYIYLDTEERRRFAQVGHEYLIEQLQWNGLELVTSFDNRYHLDFNHPTKEFFWAMINGNYISGKTFLYYSNKDEWSVIDASCEILKKSISIGSDPTDITGGQWYEVSPNSSQTVIQLYINNQNSNSVWVNPTSVSIENYGITSKIIANILIDADGNITCSDIETGITIRDLSIPVELMTDTRFNVCDPIVYLFSNYGLLIDGTINPIQWGLIQMNGHDRFDRREGAYFNYVQPNQCHENTPKDGINIYSFALYPEEHQPSGTSNLSRIDSTDLILWFNDPTQTTGLPSLNFVNDDSRIYMYGLNYNILRFLAGMSGLAYSLAF